MSASGSSSDAGCRGGGNGKAFRAGEVGLDVRGEVMGGSSPNIRARALERFVRPVRRSVRPCSLMESGGPWHTAKSSASERALPNELVNASDGEQSIDVPLSG